MASYRKRGRSYEFKVTRRRILPSPGYKCFTFDSIREGREYCAQLEKLLDQGIMPEEFLKKTGKDYSQSVRDVMLEYQRRISINDNDRRLLTVSMERIGGNPLTDITYDWSEAWVTEMKRQRNLVPGTIRHHVGAVARCLDWAVKKGYLAINPLRTLPRGYANYTDEDRKYVEAKSDVERSTRLEPGQEEAIRQVLNSGKLKERSAMILVFELALETAMRLREIYTLDRNQIDLPRRTIFLEKTKNGDHRQVPLSTVAVSALENYFSELPEEDERGGGLLFPWWDGDTAPANLRNVTSKVSKKWQTVFKNANCKGFHFHDLRHEATCRFYERTTLGDVQIARITGHKDLKMLKRYANLRASDLASQLW